MGDDSATDVHKPEDSKPDMTEKVKKVIMPTPNTTSSAPEKRTRGITDCITVLGATDDDLRITSEMRTELELHHPGESEQGMKNRILVLEKLEQLAAEWVIEVAKSEQIESAAPSVKLCTFGSYRLGAVNPGSDIDALLLGPKFVTREHFFTGMVNKLRQHKDVTSLLPVPDAYTPIVSLKFFEVEIDLLYCQLDMDTIPKDINLTADDRLLQGLDDKDLRSINGCRVAEMIIHMVPDHKIYTDTLKFIKCWAKRRGIYSNVMGYFGGITWALCVARVCQLYPNYCMSMLVHKFFRVFDQWNWSKPILLCPIPEIFSAINSAFKVWNPKVNATDRSHLMPVITPAFPNMNSTHNVTESTKRIICDEIHRGYQICKDVESNKALYVDLYAPSTFFKLYKNYIMIQIEVADEDGFRRYSGWVESKIRLLVSNLENTAGLRVHPYSRSCSWATVEDKTQIPKEELEVTTYSTSWFIGLAFCQDNGAFVGQTVDVRPAICPFIDVLQEWKDLLTTQVKIRVQRVSQSELPAYCHLQEDPLRAKSSKFKMDVGGNHEANATETAEGGSSPRRKKGDQRHPSCSSQRSANRQKRHASEDRTTPGGRGPPNDVASTGPPTKNDASSSQATPVPPRNASMSPRKARPMSEDRRSDHTGGTRARKREKTETEASEIASSSSTKEAKKVRRRESESPTRRRTGVAAGGGDDGNAAGGGGPGGATTGSLTTSGKEDRASVEACSKGSKHTNDTVSPVMEEKEGDVGGAT